MIAARPARASGLAAMVTAGARPDDVAEAAALLVAPEARELAEEPAAEALDIRLLAAELAEFVTEASDDEAAERALEALEPTELAEADAPLAALLRLLAAAPAALVMVLVTA